MWDPNSMPPEPQLLSRTNARMQRGPVMVGDVLYSKGEVLVRGDSLTSNWSSSGDEA